MYNNLVRVGYWPVKTEPCDNSVQLRTASYFTSDTTYNSTPTSSLSSPVLSPVSSPALSPVPSPISTLVPYETITPIWNITPTRRRASTKKSRLSKRKPPTTTKRKSLKAIRSDSELPRKRAKLHSPNLSKHESKQINTARTSFDADDSKVYQYRYSINNNRSDEEESDFSDVDLTDVEDVIRQTDLSNLDDEVLRQLQRVVDWDAWYVDATITQAISDGKLHNCKIRHEIGNPQVMSLFATSTINKYECIGALAGELWSKKDFIAYLKDEESPKHTLAYDITRPLIGDSYRGPPLVLYCGNKSNELRHLQDYSWHSLTRNPAAASPNIKSDVAWCHEDNIPVVVFTALRRIKKGEELLVDWGDDIWNYNAKRNLDSQSYISHKWHIQCSDIELQLRRHHISVDYQAPKVASTATFTHHCERMTYTGFKSTADLASTYIGDNTENNSLSVDEGFTELKCELEAFPDTKCRMATRMDVQISAKTRAELDKYRTSKNFAHRLLQNLPQLMRLRHGNVNKVGIREIVALHHPARWFTPPHKRAYALVATEDIPKDEWVGLYLGTLIEEDKATETDEQMYAFGIDLGDGYNGTPLVIKSFSYGNATRFINDCYCRKDKKSSVNAVADILWDDQANIPVVGIKIIKNVTQGCEIVLEYGENYWIHAAKYLMLSHASYAQYMDDRLQTMTERCKRHGVRVAPPPTTHFVQNCTTFRSGTIEYKL